MSHAKGSRGARTRWRWRWPWVAGLAAALLFGVARPVSAEESSCSDCEAPTGECLQDLAGFTLEVRDGERDYVEVDGGECKFTILPPPRYRIVHEWWVLRGSGMVWDCPHSKSCDTIVAETSEEDSTEWSSSHGGSGGFSAFGLSFGASLLEAVSHGLRLKEVTRIEKNICATWCHRITWDAYFHIAEYRGEIDWKVTRRFAWWTKNDETGATVHQSGDVYVDCAAGTASFGRLAPIDVAVHLFDQGCPDAVECSTVTPGDLGFYPPIERENPPPPVITVTEEDMAPPAPAPAPAPEVAPEEEDDPYGVGSPPAGPAPVPPGFEDDDAELPFYETGPSTEEPWIPEDVAGTQVEVLK